MTADEQLALWLKGQSIHNYEREECCPDFSCCLPHLFAPLEAREMFCAADKNGDEKLRMKMLGEFLSRLIESECGDKKVYIAGADLFHEVDNDKRD